MAWFKQLPWMVWGTELGQSYAQMQIPAAGSVWLALFLGTDRPWVLRHFGRCCEFGGDEF